MSNSNRGTTEISDVVAWCAALAKDWDYVPFKGNLGDALIAAGAVTAFARAGVSLSVYDGKQDRADRPVMIAGGGNLVPYYHDVERVLRHLLTSSVAKVVVLPQTIAGHDQLLAGLDQRFHIFCRDRVSFAHVRTLHRHFVAMDHDMATHIDPELLFADYEKLVSRADVRILRAIERITTRATEHSRRNRRRGRLLREDVESARGRSQGENLDISGLCISAWANPDLVRLLAATFLRAISMFDEIETDRLHVAIAGGLLGIPVLFHPNSYHKNKSVHEFTISRFYPSVRMVTP